MNKTSTILMALLSLTMSISSYGQVQAAKSSNIPITSSSLPFTVPGPGTYVLTSDLTCPTTSGAAIAAITIPANLPGPVIVDLKGFTLTGGGPVSIGVSIGGPTPVSNAFPITVRNGTIQNVSFGVWPESNGLTTALSEITVANLTISTVEPPAGNSTCVLFGGYVENSTVRNCSFNNATYGIEDVLSPGGNQYINISWNNVSQLFFIDAAQASPTGLLERCEFAAPGTTP